MAKKEYIGVEPPFLGFGVPIKGVTGKIPKLPETAKSELDTNPSTLFQVSQNLTSNANWQTVAELNNSEYQVYSIIITSSEAAAGLNIFLSDQTGAHQVYHYALQATNPLIINSSVPIIFKNKVQLYSNTVGDSLFVTLRGFIVPKI